MNILLDFLTFKWQTGAGEYARRVYYSLLQRIADGTIENVRLFALFDSEEGIAYDDMKKGSRFTSSIEFLDLREKPLLEQIDEHKIDILFIACAQYWGKCQGLGDVKCKTVCVIHDLAYEELFSNNLNYYFKLTTPKYHLSDRYNRIGEYFYNTFRIVKWFIDVRWKHALEGGLDLIKPAIELINNNDDDDVNVVTVSEYTRNLLLFHYNIDTNIIKVLYSPERMYVNSTGITENRELAELIEKGSKFYIMLSANRNSKNPHKAVRAFKRYSEIDKDAYFVVVGYKDKVFDRMINPSYLSDGDLLLALQHCYALVYPTFYEGFGYPALEAMRFGKPVLASNTTSLPEILGNAPVYFSPIFESDIFNALTKLTDENYGIYVEKSKMQFNKVNKRQEEDLNKIVDIILN